MSASPHPGSVVAGKATPRTELAVNFVPFTSQTRRTELDLVLRNSTVILATIQQLEDHRRRLCCLGLAPSP